MKRSEAILGLVRIPMDILAVLAALLLSYQLRAENRDLIPSIQLLEPSQSLPTLDYYVSSFVMPGVLLFIFIAASLRLYALREPMGGRNELVRVVLCTALWLVGVMTWYFFVRKQLFFSRILLAYSTFFIAMFVVLGRMGIILLKHMLLRHGIGTYLVASVGKQPIARSARDTLGRNIHFEYLGHVSDLPALKGLLKKARPDLVIQSDPDSRGDQTIKLIEFCRSSHLGYAFLPPVLADVPHQLEVDRLGLVPMIRFKPTPLDGWGRIGKRLFDFVVSALLLVLLLPVWIIVSIAVIIDSGWPVLYVSRRVGEQGSVHIPVIKFRSMVKNADALKKGLHTKNQRKDGPLFKMVDDPRITKVGRMIRRFDIDELPQLVNVFLGHMSLVGPRPHLPEEVAKYKPYERRVFAVKPGITGLAQVSGRSDLSFKEEVRLDLRYVEEWSFLMDIHVLLRTVYVSLLGKHHDRR